MSVNVESVEPDLQVVVSVRGVEIAVFGFFRRTDQVDGFDAVAGIAERREIGAIESLLNLSIEALHGQAWLDVDSLGAYLDAQEGNLPF